MQPNSLVKRTGALPLALGTISFAVCFAAWGLIAAFAPRFRDTFHLSATQAALLVAVPVLLGSLARLPVGMLADRFGGRLVFSVADAVVRRSCISDADGRIPMTIAVRRILSGTGGIILCRRRRIRLALVQRGDSKAVRSAFTDWAILANPRRCFWGRCSRFRSDGRTCFAAWPSCWSSGPSSFGCSRATRR